MAQGIRGSAGHCGGAVCCREGQRADDDAATAGARFDHRGTQRQGGPDHGGRSRFVRSVGADGGDARSASAGQSGHAQLDVVRNVREVCGRPGAVSAATSGRRQMRRDSSHRAQSRRDRVEGAAPRDRRLRKLRQQRTLRRRWWIRLGYRVRSSVAVVAYAGVRILRAPVKFSQHRS